jgi:hypothetical protein
MSWQGHNWRVVNYVCASKFFYHSPDLLLRRPWYGPLYRGRSLSLWPTGGVKSTYELIGYSVTAKSYSVTPPSIASHVPPWVCSASIFTRPSCQIMRFDTWVLSCPVCATPAVTWVFAMIDWWNYLK